MNKKALLKLADALEGKMPKGFRWDFGEILVADGSCGTVGCAVGLGVVTGIIPGVTTADLLNGEFDTPAKKAFGLTQDEYVAIFMEWDRHQRTRTGNVTPRAVAKTIRKFVETGKRPELVWP